MNQTVIDYTYIQNTIWKLKAIYPAVRVCRIGKSVVGRSIYALEIGRSTAPAKLFLSTFLGQDDFTGELLLTWFAKVAKGVCEGGKVDGVAAGELVRSNRIVIIPFVNPDGREICQRGAHCGGIDCGKIKRMSGGDTTHWDANARGVDITGNFDFRFAVRKKQQQNRGEYFPGGKGYVGPYPESEPETQGITHFCRRQAISGAVCLYPGKGSIFWRSPGVTDTALEKQSRVLGVVSDYEVEAPVGCVVDSGFRNWFTATFRKPALDIMVKNNRDVCHRAKLQELLTLSCLF